MPRIFLIKMAVLWEENDLFISYLPSSSCFELQQSHEMDYENRSHFAIKFAQDSWQIRTLHGNGVRGDVYIK